MGNSLLNIKLLGKEVLTELDEVIGFDTSTKKEQTYYLNSSDAAETIDYSDIVNCRAIIFLSDQPFNIAITSLGSTVNIPVKEIFVLTPNSLSDFDSIELTSLYATSHYIQVRFYGVAS